ncbi:hypothetical protein DBV15_03783 [Temnothorax longispinosus]|uniref:Uncharacterized protein n=1 Tax=Temnothorax longispinosus TaxID=300112 RepID=A0A4S2JAP1_9HYME|nr:hypothetical protein DBV15_03783 [Temnothorax longispinosus]
MTHLRRSNYKVNKRTNRGARKCLFYSLGIIERRRRSGPKREPTGVCQPMDRSILHPKEVCGLHHGNGRYGERKREKEKEKPRASDSTEDDDDLRCEPFFSHCYSE